MKVALLFLTIGDIHFPNIWNNYFKNYLDYINIYCHPKYPQNIKTTWLKNSIINKLSDTKWGHFTNAIINLLKSALLNKDNQKFIILSESCLPIKPFKELYSFLKKDSPKTSYVKIRKFDDHNIKKSNLPNNYLNYDLIKHSGWFCLSRHHVKKLLINNDIYKFNKVIAGDENILSLIFPDKNIKDFEIIYSNWEHNKSKIDEINKKLKILYEKKESENTSKYNKQILNLRIEKSHLGKHPKTYDQLNESELNEIKNSESFFFRKFSPKSNITDHYKQFT